MPCPNKCKLSGLHINIISHDKMLIFFFVNFSLGSVCSHVAALLFKLHAACQMDLNKVACTSQLCSWKKSRKRAHPAPLQNISFKRPKKENTIPNVDGPFEGTLNGFYSHDPIKFCTTQKSQMLAELKEIAPKAALLTYVSLDDMSDGKNKEESKEEETET